MPVLDRKAARSSRTRRRLLREARRLFATRGYERTPAGSIAERAGITRAALYYHFRDKRELLRVVCEEMEDVCVDNISRAIAQAPDFRQQMDAAVQSMLDAFANPAYVRIVFRDGPAVLGWDVWHDIVGRFGRNQLRLGLEVAMDEGQLARRPAAALARVISGAINEAGLAIAHADDPKQARADYGTVVGALLDGLLRPDVDRGRGEIATR